MWESRDSSPTLLKQEAGGFTLLCTKLCPVCCKGCNDDFSVPTDMVAELRKSFGEGNGMSWALNVNEVLGRWRRKLGMFLL